MDAGQRDRIITAAIIEVSNDIHRGAQGARIGAHLDAHCVCWRENSCDEAWVAYGANRAKIVYRVELILFPDGCDGS